jgi:uncharacterized RDD family membrane protein YckC
MFAGMAAAHKPAAASRRGFAGIFPPVNDLTALRPGGLFPCPVRDLAVEDWSMTNSGSDNGGAWRNDGGVQPHVFDPVLQPELFSGVLFKRSIAFLIDVVVLTVPVVLGYIFIGLFGLLTLGLGWVLFWLAWPATVVWAVVYYGATLGGAHSATVGMRVMDIELRTWYGSPGYFVLGAMHAVLFWVSISFLSPLVLLVGLFNGRRRLLHDVILGTVVINSLGRTQAAQPARTY